MYLELTRTELMLHPVARKKLQLDGWLERATRYIIRNNQYFKKPVEAYKLKIKELKKKEKAPDGVKNYKELCKYLGMPVPDDDVNKLLPGGVREKVFNKFAEKGAQQRAGWQKICLQEAIHQGVKDEWYFVFDTLTINAEHYDQMFEKGSKYFRQYQRNLTNLVKRLIYGSVQKAKGKPEVSWYFCVPEYGGETGRYHLHVLWAFAEIPTEWRNDPTDYKNYYREITALKTYWEYGYSTPIAVRYAGGDAFTKLGWRWPRIKKTGAPILSRPAAAIGGYITKYLNKSEKRPTGGIVKWRIKKSRQLQAPTIKKLIRARPKQALTGRLSLNLLRSLNLNLNPGLVRKIFLKEIYLPKISKEQALAMCGKVKKTLTLANCLKRTTQDVLTFKLPSYMKLNCQKDLDSKVEDLRKRQEAVRAKLKVLGKADEELLNLFPAALGGRCQ